MPEQQKPNTTHPATQKPAAQTPNSPQKPVQQPQAQKLPERAKDGTALNPPPPPPVDNEHVAEGAQQFDSPPEKTAAQDSPPTLEDRVTELEAVVHAIAPYSRNAEHGTVKSWLKKVGARMEKLF